MNSRLTEDFVECFRRLPDAVKSQARKNYRLWRTNPAHPSLHFKRVHSHDALYSIRVGLGWRALGFVEAGAIHWYWIGSHAEYDKMLKQM